MARVTGAGNTATCSRSARSTIRLWHRSEPKEVARTAAERDGGRAVELKEPNMVTNMVKAAGITNQGTLRGRAAGTTKTTTTTTVKATTNKDIKTTTTTTTKADGEEEAAGREWGKAERDMSRVDIRVKEEYIV